MRIALFFTLSLFAVSVPGLGTTFHVPGDYSTIQEGIEVAERGDTVLVAPGTYMENIDFLGKEILLKSEQGAAFTIIDGGNPSDPEFGSVVTFSNNEAPLSVLDGFTVTNGTDIMDGLDFIFLSPDCYLDWGACMIDADPQFIDPARNDYHLTYSSPCREAGDNRVAAPDENDVEGDPRIAAGTVDLGADEIYTHLYCMGEATPGGLVQAKVIGLPGTETVYLYFGSGVLDPPMVTPFGEWYLQSPLVGPIILPTIPTSGVLEMSATVPVYWLAPLNVPMQVFVGDMLSNLYILKIR